jgi:MoxR-like ATPase
MIPAEPSRSSVNPRQVLERGGPDQLAQYLANTGYITQERVLCDMSLAIRGFMPHLVEGPRGGGKTALAEALAKGCNLPVFYIQGMDGLQLEEVLYRWDRESQAEHVRQAILSGQNLNDARADQWSRDYLILGEALAAFDYAAKHDTVPVLIVDEIDKLSEAIEDMLLQLFGRGYAHVPRLGNIGVTDKRRWPIVVLLSNNMRHDLSAPMRSRCVYTYMPLPTGQEKVSILRARVPSAGAEMVGIVAKLLSAIEGIPGVLDKPALREAIAILEAWTRDGIKEVTEDVLKTYLCLMAKRHGDADYLGCALARVERDINGPDREIDEWVAREFAARPRLVAA